jgi:hypothetical protein
MNLLNKTTEGKVDCLIVRQPYASLIAYGVKRIEFRTQNCTKRGPILIASARGRALKTGDNYLNSISKSFPRGYILANAVLADAFIGNNEFIREKLVGEETVCIHKHEFQVASKPFGEPINDLLKAASDKNWKRYFWVLKDVRPLSNIIPLTGKGTGSSWIQVKQLDNASTSTILEDYI